MECPSCGYDFDSTTGLQCPRCGEVLTCSSVTCAECDACANPIRILKRQLFREKPPVTAEQTAEERS